MGLKHDITDGIARALKGGEKLRLSTLRLLLAAVINREKEKRAELTDEEIQGVASTLAKQRRDSIEQFRKGGRTDLAEKEEKELEIVKTFLPAQLSCQEIEEVVKNTAAEVGAEGMKDMGRLMNAVMAKLRGRADGRAVQESVRKILSA